MKRMSCLVVTMCCVLIAFLAVLSGCDTKENDDKLINAGLASAAEMKEAVCDETYRNIMSASATTNNSDMVSVVSNENVNKYKAVYKVSFDPEKVLGSFTDKFENYDKLSSNLQKKIIAQVYGSIPSMINSNKGTSAMAFAALFNDGGSIKDDTLKERMILVFVFESGYPIWITYSPVDNDLVSYVSNWIIADCTKIDSEDSFIKELQLDNIPTLEVKMIK
ncbi:MAG: hypothetical protein II685_06220 [Clostridia bacterium]|nr:hypothetical protein [Clostridia bacterium]